MRASPFAPGKRVRLVHRVLLKDGWVVAHVNEFPCPDTRKKLDSRVSRIRRALARDPETRKGIRTTREWPES
jgi:hypothetical protein